MLPTRCNTMAGPAFFWGGAPIAKLVYIFLSKTAWKWKNLDPEGGTRPWCPLGSDNVIDLIIPHLLPHFSESATADNTHLASDFVLCLGPTLYAFTRTTLTLRLTLFCAWVLLSMRSPGQHSPCVWLYSAPGSRSLCVHQDNTHLASDFILRLGPALYAFPGTTLTLRLTLFCAWVPLSMCSPEQHSPCVWLYSAPGSLSLCIPGTTLTLHLTLFCAWVPLSMRSPGQHSPCVWLYSAVGSRSLCVHQDNTHLASDFVLCLGPALYAFPGTTLTLRLTLFCGWVPLSMRSPGQHSPCVWLCSAPGSRSLCVPRDSVWTRDARWWSCRLLAWRRSAGRRGRQRRRCSKPDVTGVRSAAPGGNNRTKLRLNLF